MRCVLTKFLCFGLVFILTPLSNLFGHSISNESRREYAIKFHEAFVLQSIGSTRKAYYCFKIAQQLAQKAGESSQKIQIMNDLFVWYRKYGYSLRIMSCSSGCSGEFDPYFPSAFIRYPPLARIPDYHSEWGNTPEQAALIREFMLGVGETISGIFCVTVSSGLGAGVGITLTLDGMRRMFVTLNDAWLSHEKALLELKQWEEKTKNRIDN